jgi:ABC-type glycerol-3-phosphate transport system substrate-binding protein
LGRAGQVAAGVGLAPLAAAVAGCAVGGPPPGATREGRTLEVYTGFSEGRMGEAIVKVLRHFDQTVGERLGYRAQHVLVPWGEMHTKVQTVVAGGTPPAAFRGWSRSIPVLAPSGALTALDPFVQKDKDWNGADIWPSTVEEMQLGGKTYGAPISSQVDFLYFNKGLLRQAGLDPGQPPADLDGWVQWGEKTTELGPERSIVRAGFLPPVIGDLLTWGTVFGGRFYDPPAQKATLTHPGVVRMLEWQKTFVDRWGAKPIADFIAAYSADGWGRKSRDGAYYTGRFVAWVQAVWLYNDVREFGPSVDFGVAPVPPPKGAQAPPGVTRVNHYLMPAGAPQPEGAWALLKYMSKDPYVTEHKVLVDSVPPSRRSLATDRRFEAQAPWLKMARDDILPKAVTHPMIPNLEFLQSQLSGALAAVRRAEKAPRQALEDAQQAVQVDLEQKLKR